jgi:diaminohydroxyphosphoribosylaminopyrimidine deaminase/5-amino-6-(5-phosphoribosylamino)uracil reductase
VAGEDASHTTKEALERAGVVVLRSNAPDGSLDLTATLELLAERGVTRLMVEGGPTLAAVMVAADLIDEAVLFHSPVTVGADGIDALDGLPLTALTQTLKQTASDKVGADRRDVFERE